MGSSTRVDRSIGKKFGGMLSGLLGGLYDTSGLAPNEEFLPANVEGPVGASGNLPYKGTGVFGGLKAKGANAQFQAQNAMAELDMGRRMRFLKDSLPIQNTAALDLLGKTNEMEDARGFKKLGDTGAALGIALGNLGPGQLESLGAPATFSSPQEQANWYASAYGNLPVSEAPLKALNNANQLQVQAKPEVLNSLVNQEVNKGLTTVGDSKIDITGKQVYEGSGTDYEEQLIPITKSVMNLETGQMEEQVTGYKTTRTPRRRQAGVMNLADYRVTPEDIAATAGGNAGNTGVQPSNQPPISAKPYGYDSGVVDESMPDSVTTQPQQPQLQGILPELVRGKFGFGNIGNWYNQNYGQPMANLVTAPGLPEVGPGLNQLKTNTGNILGDLRKAMIRGSTEQSSGQPIVESVRGGLQGAGAALGNILESGLSPIGDTLNGIVAGMHENEAEGRGLPPINYGKPLPVPRKDITRYMQNRANNPRYRQLISATGK